MRRPLTGVESRLAALAVTAVALTLLYYVAVQWWFVAPLADIDEEMATLRAAHSRYAALLAQREPLRKQLDAAMAADAGAVSLLAGEDESAGMATLMQRVAGTVERHRRLGGGCEMLNRTPMSGRPADGAYAEVRLGVSLSCAIEPLAAVLHALEQEPPLLRIDELGIQRDASAPDRGGAGRLKVQLLVSGYLRRGNAPAPGKPS